MNPRCDQSLLDNTFLTLAGRELNKEYSLQPGYDLTGRRLGYKIYLTGYTIPALKECF